MISKMKIHTDVEFHEIKDFQRILKLMTAGLLMNYTYLFFSD